ncbi:MAG: hypothetical protein WA949_20500, partial [Phormidesmis sp.]
DQANEARLYDQLSKAQTAYLSVGHRESLQNYHQSLLRLAEDHSWTIQNLDDTKEPPAIDSH